MYLDPRSEIAGLPALEVRRLLQRVDTSDWTLGYAQEILEVSSEVSKQLIDELLAHGYIRRATDHQRSEEPWYERTLDGARLALASAAKPLTRRTAERKVVEFLERVREVNKGGRFLYSVRRVVAFGSYLTDAQRLNDVDLAVELEHVEPDREKAHDMDRERIREAYAAGRRFSNIVNELFWPYNEVLFFLKARSRAISLHTTDDEVLKRTETRMIYDSNTDS